MVFIVIPAYNEAKTIGRVIRGLFEQGFVNVVVVDDGSSDATAELAGQAGAMVLRHCVNRGQGAALQTGNEFALQSGAKYIVHFDADGQFNAADIAPALQCIRNNQLDIVLGSRFLDRRSNVPWSKQYVFFPLGRWLHRLFIGIKLTDLNNGFRIISRAAAEHINIAQDGMAHNSEILFHIKNTGLKFQEVPVRVIYYEYGLGAKGGLKIIRDLLWSRIFKS